jgi:hypothetical protein
MRENLIPYRVRETSEILRNRRAIHRDSGKPCGKPLLGGPQMSLGFYLFVTCPKNRLEKDS